MGLVGGGGVHIGKEWENEKKNIFWNNNRIT